MTDYISISSWGLFPTEHQSRRIDEPEIMRAKLRKFEKLMYPKFTPTTDIKS